MKEYEKEMEKVEDTNLANAESDKEGENIEKLFTPEFLKEHSKLDNVEELYDKLGVHMKEDFERRNKEEINEVVSKYTDFETFEEMFEAAKEKK